MKKGLTFELFFFSFGIFQAGKKEQKKDLIEKMQKMEERKGGEP